MEIAYDHTEMLLLTLHANNAKLISHLAGMGSPQDIPTASFTGKPDSKLPADLAPGKPGINFGKTDATITFPFGPGKTPIVSSVSVPKGTTNVDEITERHYDLPRNIATRHQHSHRIPCYTVARRQHRDCDTAHI